MQLNNLSDKLLMKVLSFLSPKDLLRSTRAVCRRWRVLSLKREVWKHCSFDGDCGYDWRCLKLALRLAPCMNTLKLNPYLKSHIQNDEKRMEFVNSVMALLGSTSCAVSRMFVTVFQRTDVDCFSKILPHQQSLGLLRSVHFRIPTSLEYHKPLLNLVGLVSQSNCLEEITIVSVHPLHTESIRWNTQLPSREPYLKKLLYQCCFTGCGVLSDPSQDLFLGKLLSQNCSTLESVSLSPIYGPLAFPILADCPNLREAWVPATNGLEALLQCAHLTSLYLDLPKDGVVQEGVITFFTSASILASLKLLFDDLPDNHFPWEAIISSLASSGKSKLKTLAVGGITENSTDTGVASAEGMDFIPSYLSALPLLHTIVLSDRLFSRKILEAVSPSVAPSLRVLCTRYAKPCCPRGECDLNSSRELCYLAAMREALRRNPLLHLEGLNTEHACEPWFWDSCVCCSSGLHSSVKPRPLLSTPNLASFRYVGGYYRQPNTDISAFLREETKRPWLPEEEREGCEECDAPPPLPAVVFAYYAHDSSERCCLHESSYTWVRVAFLEKDTEALAST